MKDSIHKKLIGHIRKTIGSYELPYEPGSWEEFQRQQRKRKQRPLIWFRYALAACLLLGVLGVPVWLYEGRPDSDQVAVRPPKTGFSEKKEGRLVGRKRQGSDAAESIKQSKSLDAAQETSLSLFTPKSPKGDLAAAKSGFRKSPLGDLGVKSGSSESLDSFFNTRHTNLPAIYSDRPSATYDPIVPRSIRFAQRPRQALALPLTFWTQQPAGAKIEPSKTGQKPIWGLSLTPQSVHAAGSSPARALGGGLFSEIPLVSRFSVSTGLSVAQQNLGTAEPAAVLFSTVPQLISTNIRLTAVDLPLNIRFRPKKSSGTGFYAEAGLSSVAFLNEHYAYTYEQAKPVTILVMGTNGQEQQVTQYVREQEMINRSEPAFQKIYWGRIVNLSIGVERRIGTRLRLSAEPYLKYPIGPFTRENLMVGSGGVNLRLGFQSGK
ncbi:hypothetical protein GCM10028803_59620 [Larkinella knui]|uniref:Outer membrane protein beta-barrel domain-containing protein n=1 Tax=Larkinella knui TaxID=2025310 RepID=A0A3P1CAH1_9BACT|nr:hypothetical protein [Larkinella knui]RRB10312.1 hypothetical protein EHT87_29205 [Larkinella knui]